MLWFVNIGALAGLAAVAIPIVIHLLKSKRRTQTIPSLLLFTALRPPTRRRKLRDLLLLLVRSLAVAALALLLARPFLKWTGSFLRASDGRRVVLGLVIDDGLTSFLAINGRRCFDLARERAIKRLQALSEDSLVILSTTSLGGCSRPMPAARAMAILEKMEPFPVRGDLDESLSATWDEIRGVEDVDHGALAIFAPPAESLWANVKTQPAEELELLMGDDLGPGEMDPRIINVVANEDGELSAVVTGTPAALTRCVFSVKDSSGNTLHSERVSLETALRERIAIPAKILGNARAISVHISPLTGKAASPMMSYYHILEESNANQRRNRILILYDDSEASEIHAQIIYVALDATKRDDQESIAFVNVETAEKKTLEAIPVQSIVACPLSDYGPVNSWLVNAISSGADALIFPPLTDKTKPLSNFPDAVRPRFQELKAFNKPVPLSLVNRGDMNRRLTELYGHGLSRVRVRRCRPPLTSPEDIPLFTCDALPVIIRRPLESGGTLTLWGVPLDGDAVSLLGNPMFPQLMKTLVVSSMKRAPTSTRPMGSVVDVADWLTMETGECDLVSPETDGRHLSWSPGQSRSLTLDQCGFYIFKFKSDDGSDSRQVIKAVNTPTLTPGAIDSTTIRSFLPPGAQWLTMKTNIQYKPIPRRDVEPTNPQGIIRDLTPPIALFLWLLLMIEMFLNAFRVMGRKLGGEVPSPHMDSDSANAPPSQPRTNLS